MILPTRFASFLRFAARLSDWIQQLLKRNLPVVVQESIPSGTARPAVHDTLRTRIGVLWRHFMASFAVRSVRPLLRSSFNSLHDVASGVQVLLPARRPSNVAGLVVPVVVDAVKGKAEWSLSNILSERLEGAPPLLTNGDASPSVVLEIRSIRISASLDHVRPSVVEGLLRLVAHGGSFGRAAIVQQNLGGS